MAQLALQGLPADVVSDGMVPMFVAWKPFVCRQHGSRQPAGFVSQSSNYQ